MDKTELIQLARRLEQIASQIESPFGEQRNEIYNIADELLDKARAQGLEESQAIFNQIDKKMLEQFKLTRRTVGRPKQVKH